MMCKEPTCELGPFALNILFALGQPAVGAAQAAFDSAYSAKGLTYSNDYALGGWIPTCTECQGTGWAMLTSRVRVGYYPCESSNGPLWAHPGPTPLQKGNLKDQLTLIQKELAARIAFQKAYASNNRGQIMLTISKILRIESRAKKRVKEAQEQK